MNEQIKKLVNKFTASPHYKYVRVLIYAIIIFIATFTLSEQRGFFRTLPFVLVLPAVATLFYNKRTLTVILCGVLAMFFGLVDTADISDAVLTAIIAMIFAFAGILTKRLIVTGKLYSGRRLLCYSLSAVLVIIGTLGYFAYFGNPIGTVGNHNDNVKYIRATYPDEDISIGATAYSFRDKTYYTSCKIDCGRSKIFADISANEPERTDRYRKYLEYTMLSDRITELSRTIMTGFPGESVIFREAGFSRDVPLSQAVTPESVRAHMSFDIAFVAQITDIAEFEKKCAEYAEFLEKSSFEYKRITFYGGFADEYRFCAVYENNSVSVSEIPKTSFDKDANAEYFTHGWRYTF